jgi:hypothetical protein
MGDNNRYQCILKKKISPSYIEEENKIQTPKINGSSRSKSIKKKEIERKERKLLLQTQ